MKIIQYFADAAMNVIDGFDWLWSKHDRIGWGLVALAMVPMTVGAFKASFYPFAFGVGVIVVTCVAAYIKGRES